MVLANTLEKDNRRVNAYHQKRLYDECWKASLKYSSQLIESNKLFALLTSETLLMMSSYEEPYLSFVSIFIGVNFFFAYFFILILLLL